MDRKTTGWVAGALLFAAAGAAGQEAPFEWSERMAAGQVLEVRSISGDVVARLADGASARVVARKTGRSRDFDRLEVRVERSRDVVTLCVVYVDRASSDEGCDPYDDRNRDERNRRGRRDEIRAGVDFDIELPAGVELDANVVSGDIDVSDVRSDVSASTVSGDVHVSTSGGARGSTVSGSLDMRMASTDWDDLHYSTVSGDITLYLPASIEADVDFESLSGDLRSDFDLTLQGRQRRSFVGEHVRGTIGGGGRSLSMKTVSGDARLYRIGG